LHHTSEPPLIRHGSRDRAGERLSDGEREWSGHGRPQHSGLSPDVLAERHVGRPRANIAQLESGFLKKRFASVEVVDATNALRLVNYAGSTRVCHGTLANRRMQPHSLRRFKLSSQYFHHGRDAPSVGLGRALLARIS
jgi:hypothetical protein